MKYGIAITDDGGHPDGTSKIVGWTKNADGSDQTWDDYGKALEANDIEHGWVGYVRVYPSGVKVVSDPR